MSLPVLRLLGSESGSEGLSARECFADEADYRNEYYNSKPGRMHDAEAADAATQGGSVRG